MSAEDPGPVTARPLRMARIGWIAAAVVFVVFAVTAAVMRRLNDGVPFGWKDQVGLLVVGIILAGSCIMLARPRLVADRDSIRIRAFLGGYRVVPWDLVVRIDFPRSVRFARIVLPGEETLAIYAVQRWDELGAVEAMRGLRALQAAVAQARAGSDPDQS